MHDDQLRDLLGRATAGAPDEDLTQVAWDAGLRRARRQQWTVGWLGAVAGVAAIVGAWSLGGGSTGASPGPADGGGVDDMAITSTPPGQELVPYRVVFEVTEGEARPDGPVEEWGDVAGVTVQAVEMSVETGEGTARSDHHLSLIGLGGPMTFETDGTLLSSNGCLPLRWPGAGIEDGVLVTQGVPSGLAEYDEGCQPGFPNPEDVLLYEGKWGSDNRPTSTRAALTWEDGALVASGTLMEGDILYPSTSDSGAGPRYLSLVEVPPGELSSIDDLPSTNETHPPSGTTESLEGTWYLLDLRGVEAEPATGPTLTFDGESWTVEACGLRHSAPGTVVDGAITIEGAWTVDTIERSSGCVDLPWQDLTTWETLLEAGPTTLMLEDGRYAGFTLEGELP